MNKLLILLALVLVSALPNVSGQNYNYPKASDYPNLPGSGKNVDDFVPAKWETIGKACGDLNGDKLADCALVIKGADGRFLNKNDGLGSELFDTNPRMLLVLFKDKNGYVVAGQSRSFIIPPDSPTMSEPFQQIKVKNGVLELGFESFSSAGSWSTASASYKFKWLGGRFALIGADKTDVTRNTGRIESRSYNFLTGRVKTSTGHISSDRDKVRWKNLKLKKPQTLDTFKAPFGWEIEPGYFL